MPRARARVPTRARGHGVRLELEVYETVQEARDLAEKREAWIPAPAPGPRPKGTLERRSRETCVSMIGNCRLRLGPLGKSCKLWTWQYLMRG